MHGEFGYMEGDQLGRPYDLKLLARMGVFARSQVRLIALAALLILFNTGIELLLPYLTRMAIDNYVVRQALRIDLTRAGAELEGRISRAAGEGLLRAPDGVGFVPEAVWRKLDPRLTYMLRQKGAVSQQPWYLAPRETAQDKGISAKAGLFVRAGPQLLISVKDLKQLSSQETWHLRRPDITGLIWLALLYVLAAGMAALLGYSQHVMLERAGQEVMFSLRQRLYTHLLSRSLAFFRRNPVGKLVTRLTNDVQNINEMYRNTVVGFCQDLFMLVGIVAVLLWLNFHLALLCLALVPLIAAMAWVFSRLAREAFRALQGHLGRINARLSETLTGLAVIKLFRAEKRGLEEFKELNDDYYRAGLRQIKVFAVFMPLTDLFASLAVGLIIWYGGGQVVQDQLSLGTLVAFLFYMQMFFRPVRDMAEKYNILQSAMASAERIFHLLDNQEALSQAKTKADGDELGTGEVRFKGVTFGYDPLIPVVKDIDFKIPAGEIWAVVGPTGAGKSSLVSLLMRLYDPDQGGIMIDGQDLRGLSREALSERAALVPQEVFLLSGSLEENITLGRARVTPERLQRALEVSGVNQFLGSLEQGLKTPLGEGALRLSAGQRQLVALARALAGEPRILILDEATSSVDPESERLIQQALPRVMAGRTSLVVAHRLSTIRRAHNILVMQKGRIIEQGTHEGLLAQGGLYARLVRLQEMRAREEDIHGHGS